MKKLFFAVFAAALFHAGAASAGAMEPAGFGGGYIGGHGGYAWGDREGEWAVFEPGGPPIVDDSFGYDQDGWIVGGQVGYNYIINERFLIGLEATGSFASITGALEEEFGGNGEYNALATFKGRLGYVLDNRILLFGTGGLAIAGFEFDGLTGCQFDQTRSGYLFGGGGELRISDRATVGVEYNYIDFGDETQACTSFAFLPTLSHTDATLQVVRFFFNYQLGSL